MAAMGKIPCISSYAMFSPGRNWEQIRTTIAYNDRAVIIAGSHAGISVGPDGGTHQAIEDIAITRVISNMMVISPCDAIEAKKATLALAKAGKPAYLRLAREKTGIITTEETPFELGRANLVYSPDGIAHVGIIATGALVRHAMLAAQSFEKKGIRVKVLNIHTIKPLDVNAVVALAKETGGKIITVEEHQKIGGLGGAIAETLSEHFPSHIIRIGVDDVFGQSGTPEQLIKYYHLDVDDIKKAVTQLLS
jgi:transketolase